MSAPRATAGGTAAAVFVAIAVAMRAHHTLGIGLYALAAGSLLYAAYELFGANKAKRRSPRIEGGKGGDATVIGTGKATAGRGGDVHYHDPSKE